MIAAKRETIKGNKNKTEEKKRDKTSDKLGIKIPPHSILWKILYYTLKKLSIRYKNIYKKKILTCSSYTGIM